MKLLNIIYRYNNTRTLYIFTSVTVFLTVLIYSQLFGVLFVPNTSIIDFKLIYSYQTFVDSIQTLTSMQVKDYISIHMIDYVFMLSFYPLLGLLLSTVIAQSSKHIYLLLLPLFAYMFDMTENIIIDIHLYHFPQIYPILGDIIVWITPLKFLMCVLAIIIIIYKKIKTT